MVKWFFSVVANRSACVPPLEGDNSDLGKWRWKMQNPPGGRRCENQLNGWKVPMRIVLESGVDSEKKDVLAWQFFVTVLGWRVHVTLSKAMTVTSNERG